MASESGDSTPLGVENSWAQEEEFGDDEDTQASHIQHSDNTQEQEPDFNVTAALQTSGDSTSNADGVPSEDAGDYDPESVTVTPIPQFAQQQAPLKPSPQPASKKPKTAGGFLVGDSESEEEGEDEASATPASNGLLAEPTHPKAQSMPRSPLHASTSAPAPVPDSVLEADNPVVSDVPPTSQVINAPAAPVQSQEVSPQEAPLQPTNAAKPPQNYLSMLEDQITEEPRGAMDAWLALIAEYRRRNNVDELRGVFERFLAVFPGSADIWASYMELELDQNDFARAEALFKRALPSLQNVKLWTVYLDYIRRRNDLSDTTGVARQTVAQAYEFVLANVGLDKDSGQIWADYIQFFKFGPGQIQDNNWEGKQKMDSLRKTYQRAIAIPVANVNMMWREYDQFEMSIDKKLARALLAQHSPNYMSAKSANTALDNVTRGLIRTNLPRLPPAPGFEGHEEYMHQVDIWNRWVAWEKSDPLDLKADEPEVLKKRILYCYRQALMALRFWPEMWVDAAEWCFENEITQDGRDIGMEMLLHGVDANPESVLLAFKLADRIEATYPVGDGDDAKAARGDAVRGPYTKVLDTLYVIIKSLKDQEKAVIARVNDSFAQETNDASAEKNSDDDDMDLYDSSDKVAKEKMKKSQIEAVQKGFFARTEVLSKTITSVWIALARAMRRIQGKGKPNTPLGGMRQVFTDARQRGRITSEMYVAVALMEWRVYKDQAAVKIFDRGVKLFPEDENFMVEYLKFLHSRDDFTNARVVFKTCVERLANKPDSVHKARSLFAYFHKYECQYGERSQIVELEQRMAELFPDDPKLAHFKARFSTPTFDPIATRIIVSAAAQLRPKNIMPSIEPRGSAQNSPRPSYKQRENSPRSQFFPTTDSPKRPLPFDDGEDSMNPPRKLQRGESPLKGAAGRRLDQQRRMQGGNTTAYVSAPAPLPRDINFLLGQIPPPASYDMSRLNSSGMVRLLRDTNVPDYTTWKANQDKNVRQGAAPAVHNRQVSTDYPPNGGRPQSPYDGGRGRLAPASATYRQTSLRPGSSGSSYEPPPPAMFAQNYGAAPPVQMPTPDVAGGWAPPPGSYGAPQGYAPPANYGQQMPQQQPPPYGRYF